LSKDAKEIGNENRLNSFPQVLRDKGKCDCTTVCVGSCSVLLCFHKLSVKLREHTNEEKNEFKVLADLCAWRLTLILEKKHTV